MMGAVTREGSWHGLWLAITGGRGRAEPEETVDVALRDIDLAVFDGLDGPTAYGLGADHREGRPARRR